MIVLLRTQSLHLSRIYVKAHRRIRVYLCARVDVFVESSKLLTVVFTSFVEYNAVMHPSRHPFSFVVLQGSDGDDDDGDNHRRLICSSSGERQPFKTSAAVHSAPSYATHFDTVR